METATQTKEKLQSHHEFETYKELFDNLIRNSFTIEELAKMDNNVLTREEFSNFVLGKNISEKNTTNFGDYDTIEKFADRTLKFSYRCVDEGYTSEMKEIYKLIPQVNTQQKSEIIKGLNHVIGLYGNGEQPLKQTVNLMKTLKEKGKLSYDNIMTVVNDAIEITEHGANISEFNYSCLFGKKKTTNSNNGNNFTNGTAELCYEDQINKMLNDSYKEGVNFKEGETKFGTLRFPFQKGNRNVGDSKYKIAIGNNIVTLENSDKKFLTYIANNCNPETPEGKIKLTKFMGYLKKF